MPRDTDGQSSNSDSEESVLFHGHTAVKGPKIFSKVDNKYGDEDSE